MMPFCSSSGGGLHIKRKALVFTAVASKFCGGELGAAYRGSITINYMRYCVENSTYHPAVSVQYTLQSKGLKQS